MSTLSTSILQPDSLDAIPNLDLPKPARRLMVDSLVAETRAKAPPGVQDLRAVPRMSVEELNDSDIDALRSRFRTTKLDQRGPVTKFLDLLDLPRNTLANVIAPGIARRKRESGDTGTFGMGTVRFSDILDDLGVENRVIRGVVGFVGDVAMDPLTYAGGAGFGARAVSSGGKVAQVGARGRRALETGVKAYARGQAVRSPVVQGVIDAAAKPGAVDRLRGAYAKAGVSPEDAAKRLRSSLSTRLLGGAGKPKKAAEFIGLEPTRKGGLIADALEPQGNPAARAFLREFGPDAAPGVRIGRDVNTGRMGVEFSSGGPGRIRAGTTLAHIPFTEVGLRVPAFTGAALTGMAAGTLARAGQYAGDPSRAIGPLPAAAQDITAQLDAYANEWDDLTDALEGLDRPALPTLDAPGEMDEATRQFRRGETLGRLNEVKRGFEAGLERLKQAQASPTMAAGTLESPEAALHLHQARLWEAAQARYDAMASKAQEYTDEWRSALAERNRLLGPISRRTDEMVAAETARLKAAGLDVDDARVRADAARLVHQDAMAKADGRAARLLDMSPEQVEARTKVADLLNQRVEAASRLAQVMKGPLAQTMAKGDADLAGASKMLLGLDNNDMFGPVKMAARAVFGKDSGVALGLGDVLDDVRGGVRRVFGEAPGRVRESARALKRASNPRTSHARQDALNGLYREAVDLAKAHGLPATKADELLELATVLAYKERDPAMGIFGPDDAVWDVLQDAAASATLDERVHPGLRTALEKLAKKNVDLLDDLADFDAVGVGREAYVPNVLTPEARRALTGQFGAFGETLRRGGANPAGGVAGRVAEAFERPRSTLYLDVPNPETGQPERFYGFEKVYTSFGPEDVAQLTPAAAAHVADVQRRWKLVQDSAAGLGLDADAMEWKPLSVFEINRLARRGALAPLTGGAELGRGFFETNLATMLAGRTMQSERKYRREMMESLLQRHALPVNDQELMTIARREGPLTYRLQNGAVARVLDGGEAIEIGGVRYRKPKVAKGVVDLLGHDSRVETAYLPDDMARVVEDTLAPFASEDAARGLLKLSDEATKLWKATTLLSPSWTVFDTVGGLIQSLSAVGDPVRVGKWLLPALRATFGKGDATVSVAGRQINVAELLTDPAVRGAVAEGSMGEEALVQMLADGSARLPSQATPFTGPWFKELREAAKKNTEIAAVGSRMAKVKGFRQIHEMKGLVLDEAYLRRVFGPWGRLNAKVNSWIRTTTLLALLDQGDDVASAAEKVVRSHFDMADLTRAESQVFRRLFPFYSWMKNSGVYGVRQLLSDPKYVTLAPHTAHALEEMTAGEEAIPEHLRPRWMRDQMAVQIGTDPETRYGLTLGSALPQETGMRAAAALLGAEGAQELMEYFVSSLAPVPRVIGELGGGREFFTKRTISAREGEGDLTPSEYLLGQVRPLRELGVGQARRGPTVRAFEQGLGEGAGRLLLGGRFQPMDDERVRFGLLRQFSEQERAIRKRINLLEREGQDSLPERARLLKLWEQMEQAGLGDEVPKYGARQLEAVR